jgi:hypothetical protein
VARRNSNGLFSHSVIFFPIAPVDFQSIGGGEGGGGGTFFFFSRVGGAGRGEGDPETRGTSCAIPSWNVPKSIFRSRSRRKSVTEGRQRSPKCHRRGGGGDEKVSPSFFKLLIFFVFVSAGKCQSESATGLAGARGDDGDDGGGGGDLEKHCGRTLFSILSMDRLILSTD